ncbi:hypothetical protein [Streptosporangium roseum]|uniref:hypothetical protein n=1 Tax=Streptosporangium roseum TaxID=2001 RepID=UPI00332C5338
MIVMVMVVVVVVVVVGSDHPATGASSAGSWTAMTISPSRTPMSCQVVVSRGSVPTAAT